MDNSAYLAIDPGDMTGWAKFDENGKILEYGQVSEAEFMEWITENVHENLKHVICEDFLLYQHKAMSQTNSRARKMKTSKKIGQLEMTCQLRGVPITLQPASNKPIGYMWGGLGEAPSNHSISHQFDAYAHGVFFLQKNGIRKPSIPKDVQ
jgi:hypothetical protein